MTRLASSKKVHCAAIQPKFDLAFREVAHHLHQAGFVFPHFERARLAQRFAKYFRQAQGGVNGHQPAHRRAHDPVCTGVLLEIQQFELLGGQRQDTTH